MCLSALVLCAPPNGHASPPELIPIALAAARHALEEVEAAAGKGVVSGREAAWTAAKDDALRCLVSAFVPDAASTSSAPSPPNLLIARRGYESELRRRLPPHALPEGLRDANPSNSDHAEPSECFEVDEPLVAVASAYALLQWLEKGVLAAAAVHEAIQAALVPPPVASAQSGHRGHWSSAPARVRTSG